jgi:uncharacterized protein (TIRG00374 family)
MTLLCPASASSAHGSEHDVAPASSSRPRRLKPRASFAARVILTVAVLGTATGFLVVRAGELDEAASILAHALARWIVLAVMCEAASMFVFARIQRRLLRAGGVLVPVRTMVEITVAANAMAATLPGGVAWAAVWAFHQLERRGVDRALRIWMFLMAGAFSSFALFLFFVAGVEVAGSSGPVAGLRIPAGALAAVPVGALVVYLARARRRRRRLVGPLLSSPRVPAFVQRLWNRIETITLTPTGTSLVLFFALMNWLLDAAVLVLTLKALGTPVPWHAVLVIYALTQIAASLPITPGGLVVVEGSLAALLTAYGLHTDQALAAVILYRLISFWGLVPVGWVVWGALNAQGAIGRVRRRVRPFAFQVRVQAEAASRQLEPSAAGELEASAAGELEPSAAGELEPSEIHRAVRSSDRLALQDAPLDASSADSPRAKLG